MRIHGEGKFARVKTMFGLGMAEALILLAIVLLLFGAKRIPELGSSMGRALTNFKRGLRENPTDEIGHAPGAPGERKETAKKA